MKDWEKQSLFFPPSDQSLILLIEDWLEGMSMKVNTRTAILYIGIVGCFLVGSTVLAETVINNSSSVVNQVSVSARTGSNQGSTNQGSSQGKVFIDTTVNGQNVTHVDEIVQSQNGEPKEITKQIEFQSSDQKTNVKTDVTIKVNQPQSQTQNSLSTPKVQTNKIENKKIIQIPTTHITLQPTAGKVQDQIQKKQAVLRESFMGSVFKYLTHVFKFFSF